MPVTIQLLHFLLVFYFLSQQLVFPVVYAYLIVCLIRSRGDLLIAASQKSEFILKLLDRLFIGLGVVVKVSVLGLNNSDLLLLLVN